MDSGLTSQSTSRELSRAEPTTARVTVVVPCYNQAHFLGECLESIRAQTDSRWEAVVVDDTSPDGEDIRRVVESFSDGRIRLIRHAANKGLGGSRNTGIGDSKTEFVYPLDADDRIRPDCLGALLEAFDQDSDLDCAYGDVQLFDQRSDVVAFPGPPPNRKMLRAEHTIPGAGTMMRTRLWTEFGGYDEADVLRSGREDFEFWIRAFASGCRARRVELTLYEYRILKSSMNVTCRLQDNVIAEYIYAKHRALFDGEGETKGFLCYWTEKAAQASYVRGLRGRAFSLGMKSWRIAPSRKRFQTALRSFLSPSVNDSIDAGAVRRLIPFVGYPLSGGERHRPFFVIGVGRSGSAQLGAMLGAHSRLIVPVGEVALGAAIRKFTKHGRHMNWPDLVDFTLSQVEVGTERVDLASLAQELHGVPKPSRNLAQIFNRLYRQLAGASDAEPVRWGDASPVNSFGGGARRKDADDPRALERLLDLFPDAQFVHLHRDGCEVVHAHMRAGIHAGVEDAARHWLRVGRRARLFARAHPERSIDVSFESLAREREGTLRRICEFLTLDFEPQMLAVDSAGDSEDFPDRESVKTGSPGKARRIFSASERDLLERLIGPELAELGYPPANQSVDG